MMLLVVAFLLFVGAAVAAGNDTFADPPLQVAAMPSPGLWHVSDTDFDRGNKLAPGSHVVPGPDTPATELHTVRGVIGEKIGSCPGVPRCKLWRVVWPANSDQLPTEARFGGGVYDVLPLYAPAFAGVRTAARVPRVKVGPAQPVDSLAAVLAAYDGPVILERSPALQWSAMERWTPEFFLARNDTFVGVKSTSVRTPGPTTFLYFHEAPMNAFPELVRQQRERAFTQQNMSAEAFFSYTATDTALSVAMKLDDLDPALLLDIFPWDAFVVKGSGYSLDQEHKFRNTRLWIAPPDTVTPTHYDVYHNFFAQISGTKRFLLFPPSAWQQLYLHPILHPGGRSSQVDFDATRITDDFPNFSAQPLAAFEALLQPGDVLYIPPMWFHHVTALTLSISASIWSPFDATDLDAKVLALGLPVKKQWPLSKQVASLRMFLASFLAGLPATEEIIFTDFVFAALVDSRYRNVPDGAKAAVSFCNDDVAVDAVMKDGGAEAFQLILGLAIDLYSELIVRAGLDRGMIFLADYFEFAALAIVGADNAKAFFQALVSC